MKFKFEPRDLWIGLYIGDTHNIIQYVSPAGISVKRWQCTLYFLPATCLLLLLGALLDGAGPLIYAP